MLLAKIHAAVVDGIGQDIGVVAVVVGEIQAVVVGWDLTVVDDLVG